MESSRKCGPYGRRSRLSNYAVLFSFRSNQGYQFWPSGPTLGLQKRHNACFMETGNAKNENYQPIPTILLPFLKYDNKMAVMKKVHFRAHVFVDINIIKCACFLIKLMFITEQLTTIQKVYIYWCTYSSL